MTRKERQHLDKIASLGCVVCRNAGLGASPAHCHHIRAGQGHKRASHFEAIPLCPNHHQHADGSDNYYGEVAFHYSPEEFERRYGTERKLLKQVLREAGI